MRHIYCLLSFEAPCGELQGIFDRKEVCHFQIRSLTPQQAAGNALAVRFKQHISLNKVLEVVHYRLKVLFTFLCCFGNTWRLGSCPIQVSVKHDEY
jgi:hypothetical protein